MSARIPKRYGPDGPRIKCRLGERSSAPLRTAFGTHPASYAVGTRSLPGIKRPERGVNRPHLAPSLKKQYSYTTPNLGLRGLSKGKFTFTFILYINYKYFVLWNNNNTIISNNYGKLQDLIFLFKIPTGTLKNFFEIYRQFGHAPSKTCSPALP